MLCVFCRVIFNFKQHNFNYLWSCLWESFTFTLSVNYKNIISQTISHFFVLWNTSVKKLVQAKNKVRNLRKHILWSLFLCKNAKLFTDNLEILPGHVNVRAAVSHSILSILFFKYSSPCKLSTSLFIHTKSSRAPLSACWMPLSGKVIFI